MSLIEKERILNDKIHDIYFDEESNIISHYYMLHSSRIPAPMNQIRKLLVSYQDQDYLSEAVRYSFSLGMNIWALKVAMMLEDRYNVAWTRRKIEIFSYWVWNMVEEQFTFQNASNGLVDLRIMMEKALLGQMSLYTPKVIDSLSVYEDSINWDGACLLDFYILRSPLAYLIEGAKTSLDYFKAYSMIQLEPIVLTQSINIPIDEIMYNIKAVLEQHQEIDKPILSERPFLAAEEAKQILSNYYCDSVNKEFNDIVIRERAEMRAIFRKYLDKSTDNTRLLMMYGTVDWLIDWMVAERVDMEMTRMQMVNLFQDYIVTDLVYELRDRELLYNVFQERLTMRTFKYKDIIEFFINILYTKTFTLDNINIDIALNKEAMINGLLKYFKKSREFLLNSDVKPYILGYEIGIKGNTLFQLIRKDKLDLREVLYKNSANIRR